VTTNLEFTALTGPLRPELLAHCYRMLGSIHDAEDQVQETYLRAWRGFDRFEGRSSLRRWMYRIATNVCVTAAASRTRRPLPSGLGAPSDDHRVALADRADAVEWLQPLPDSLVAPSDPAATVVQRASIRLALVAALQYLPARQRAALTLRDVLGFTGAETAEIMSTTVDGVDALLRRARSTMKSAAVVHDEVVEPDDDTTRALVADYADAFQRADAPGLVDLLRVDAEFEMPPVPTWFSGRDAVVGFLAARVLRRDRWQAVPTSANGQPAVLFHARSGNRLQPYGVQVLTFAGPRIARITAFNDPALVPLFSPTRPHRAWRAPA
jgi:RNA polymerase sigma-70 factor (TIGR02960 family)